MTGELEKTLRGFHELDASLEDWAIFVGCGPGSGCFLCRGLVDSDQRPSETYPGEPTALDLLVTHPSRLEERSDR